MDAEILHFWSFLFAYSDKCLFILYIGHEKSATMRVVILALIGVTVLYYLTVYRWRNGSHNLFMVSILFIIAAPTSYMEYQWQQSENTGSQTVASISANADGTLHCQRLSETLFDATQNIGHVSLAEPDKAVMKYKPCQELFAYIHSDKSNPTADQVEAVHVLTHESVHVSGNYNEAETECTAVQMNAKTVEQLGGTREQGVQLAKTYYTQMYPNMRQNYKSPECFENGLLDLTPDDGSFYN